MTNLGFLFTGFTVAWALAFGYVWYLARRTRSIESRLEGLERDRD